MNGLLHGFPFGSGQEPSPPEAKAAEAAEAREAGTEPKAEEPKVEEPKVEPSPEAQVPPEEDGVEPGFFP